jgi:hypothetical protein
MAFSQFKERPVYAKMGVALGYVIYGLQPIQTNVKQLASIVPPTSQRSSSTVSQSLTHTTTSPPNAFADGKVVWRAGSLTRSTTPRNFT